MKVKMETIEVEPREWAPATKFERAPAPPDDARIAWNHRIVNPQGETLAVAFPLNRDYWPAAAYLARGLNSDRRLPDEMPCPACHHPWKKHNEVTGCGGRCACPRSPIMHWDNEVNDKTGTYSGGRLSGIMYPCATFGAIAPLPMRRRFGASVALFDRRYPERSRTLRELAGGFYGTLRGLLPAIADDHEARCAKIDPGWWLAPAVPWTAGIINRTVALPYHRDRGNVEGSWSAQLVLRQGIGGGLLHFPEWDLYMECANYSVVLFPNWGAWHGVTPIEGDRLKGTYRFSIVYYAKAAMEKCAPPMDEVKRAQLQATQHERSRIEAVDAHRNADRVARKAGTP